MWGGLYNMQTGEYLSGRTGIAIGRKFRIGIGGHGGALSAERDKLVAIMIEFVTMTKNFTLFLKDGTSRHYEIAKRIFFSVPATSIQFAYITSENEITINTNNIWVCLDIR